MKAFAQAALARSALAAMRLVLHVALTLAIGVIFLYELHAAPAASKSNQTAKPQGGAPQL